MLNKSSFLLDQNSRHFIEQLLPWPDGNSDDAVVLARTLPRPGKKRAFIHERVTSPDELIEGVVRADPSLPGTDVYVCQSAQAGGGEGTRSADNATTFKSIWLDVDVGVNKDHATLEAASSALRSFVAASGMPQPTAIVESGSGLHVYWGVLHAISREHWERLAHALVRAVEHHGFNCDRTCTTDPVRLLRVPGTNNWKTGEPRPVALRTLDQLHDVEELKAALERHVGTAATTEVCSELPHRAPLPGESELAAGITDRDWFSSMPPDQQDAALDHALNWLLKRTAYFELERNGGDNATYHQIMLGCARSPAPRAEDIFVRHASCAKDADSEEELRAAFRRCANARARPDGTSVGTVIKLAQDAGADFSRWKALGSKNAGHAAAVEVHYVPGNEEECRRQLDRVVAADKNTFTLGVGGPLVILRLPNDHAVPSGLKWDSDFPATTTAETPDILERAQRLVWKRPAGGRGESRLTRCHPPRDFASDFLVQRQGRYSARPLQSICRLPKIDDATGEVSFIQGYDPCSGIFHDRTPAFHVPPQDVGRERARDLAFDVLLQPFSKYRFEDSDAGKALILAAIFTALERPWLPTAPMLVVRSSTAGSGKGKLLRTVCRLAYDAAPAIMSWGGTNEEFEKRLTSVLLCSPAAIMVDNANGRLVEGDLLESILTEGRSEIRPLGKSQIIRVSNRSLVTLTGNNPMITGDMARRALVLDIMPASPHPERQRFEFDPVSVVAHRRNDFLRAAYTIMKAWRKAGMPHQGLPSAGSFEDWSRKVRDLVYWLTGYDLSEQFVRNKEDDPRRQADEELLHALHGQFGSAEFSGAEPVRVYEEVVAFRRNPSGNGLPAPEKERLFRALEAVLPAKNITTRNFGYWARRVKGRYGGGFSLESTRCPATNTSLYKLKQV